MSRVIPNATSRTQTIEIDVKQNLTVDRIVIGRSVKLGNSQLPTRYLEVKRSDIPQSSRDQIEALIQAMEAMIDQVEEERET